MTVKEQALQLIQSLPDDCTLEEIRYRLYLQEKVAEGLADVEAGRVLAQEDVEKEVARWHESSGPERP